MSAVEKRDAESKDLVLSSRQRSLLSEMDSATREIACQMLSLHVAVNKLGTQAAYQMGAFVDKLTSDDGQHDQQSVRQVAAFLNVDESLLYSYRALVKQFDLETVVEWSTKPMSDNTLISLSHWIALTRVKGEAEQRRLLNRVIKESLSARELHDLIRSGEVATRRTAAAGAGRKPRTPTSLGGGLQTYFGVLQRAANLHPVIQESVFARTPDMTEEDVNPVLVTRLQALEALLQREEEAVKQDRKSVQQMLARAQQLLAAKDEGVPAAEATVADAGGKKSDDKATDKKAGKKAADKHADNKTGKKPTGNKAGNKAGKPAGKKAGNKAGKKAQKEPVPA